MLAYLLLPTMAFAAAIIVIGALVTTTTLVSKRGETELLQLLTILVIIGSTALPAIIRILSGFDVDDPRGAQDDTSNVFAVVWIKRIFTGGMLALTVAGLARRITTLLDQSASGGTLIIGYLLYATMSFGVGAIFSTKPAFISALYYPAFILMLVFASKTADLESVLKVARTGIGVILVVSLAMALLTPEWAFSRSGQNLIPGLPGRFVGLTSHPNVLGPLALIYLLLGTIATDHKSGTTPMRILAVLVIVLAQSKTVWAAGIVIILLILITRISSSQVFAKKSAAGWLMVGLLFGTTLVVVMFWTIAMFGPSNLGQLAGLRGIDTFVGRSEIWNITIGLWRANPWFGYGPTLWSPEFRQSYSMLYVGQAHNQLIQTLGDSGLIGLAGLFIYVATLIVYAVRLASISRGLIVGLVVLVLSRGLTETPFRSLGIADPTFLIHFAVFLAALYWARVKPTKTTVLVARAAK